MSRFLLTDANGPQETSDYFFQGGQFSGKTILVTWEHSNIPQILAALLNGSYTNLVSTPSMSLPIPTSSKTLPQALQWDALDYDSIWTITLDGSGNLTANNSLCEGINSTNLPKYAPQF